MNTEITRTRSAVGLIGDENCPGSLETLAVVAAELQKFGLTAEPPRILSPAAARAHAQTSVSLGNRALVVASAYLELAREVAAHTPLPVLRVPVRGESMPAGTLDPLWPEPEANVQVTSPDDGRAHATLAIGEPGARNAALFIVSMLALTDDELRDRWREFRRHQTEAVLAATLPTD